MSSTHENGFRPTLEALEDRLLPAISLRQLLLTRPHPRPSPAAVQAVQAVQTAITQVSNNPPAGGFSIPNFTPASNPSHDLIHDPPVAPPAQGFTMPNFNPAANPSHDLIDNPPSSVAAGFPTPNGPHSATTTPNPAPTPPIDPAAITQALIDALNRPFTFG